MECEKCQDRGFTEENHGLIMRLCDCDKAREVAEANGIPLGGASVADKGLMQQEILPPVEAVVAHSGNQEDAWRESVGEAVDQTEKSRFETEDERRNKMHETITGEINDDSRNNNDRRDNQPAGSANTGEPKQRKKRTAERKARAKGR